MCAKGKRAKATTGIFCIEIFRYSRFILRVILPHASEHEIGLSRGAKGTLISETVFSRLCDTQPFPLQTGKELSSSRFPQNGSLPVSHCKSIIIPLAVWLKNCFNLSEDFEPLSSAPPKWGRDGWGCEIFPFNLLFGDVL